MNVCRIEYADPPRVTHVMEYGGEEDIRKDKYIRGMNGDYPRVRLVGVQARHGQLKVVCVQHTAPYRLHPNLLCNKSGKRGVCRDNHVDDYGVATFDFTNETGTVDVELKELCIRRTKKEKFKDIKRNWLEQQSDIRFDPSNLGFDETNKNINFNHVSLCCQAVFEDGRSNFLISADGIVNSNDAIEIQDWEENRRVNECGNERLYIPVCKLSSDQHNGDILRVRFSICNVYRDVKPVKIHYISTIIVKIPPYAEITGESVLLEEVICKVCVIVLGKDHYTSNSKEFIFFPEERIPSKRKIFTDDENQALNSQKRRFDEPDSYVSFVQNPAIQSTNIAVNEQQSTTSDLSIQQTLPVHYSPLNENVYQQNQNQTITNNTSTNPLPEDSDSNFVFDVDDFFNFDLI